MKKNKFQILLLRKNFILLFNNKLIFNQNLLKFKKKKFKFSRSGLFYWTILIYAKRLGLIK